MKCFYFKSLYKVHEFRRLTKVLKATRSLFNCTRFVRIPSQTISQLALSYRARNASILYTQILKMCYNVTNEDFKRKGI
jgi:hypothetical protein